MWAISEKLLDVYHLKLRIGYVFGKDETGIVGYGLVEKVEVGEIDYLCLYAQSCQGCGYEREGVAEEVVGHDDGLSCFSKHEQGVKYGRHARGQGKDVFGIGESLDAVLEVGYGGVHHTRVVGFGHTASESLCHGMSRVKLVGYRVVDWER